MDDPTQSSSTFRPRPAIAGRPFARPDRPAERPTPLGTRSVLFVPPEARLEMSGEFGAEPGGPVAAAEGAVDHHDPEVAGLEESVEAAAGPPATESPTVSWERTIEVGGPRGPEPAAGAADVSTPPATDAEEGEGEGKGEGEDWADVTDYPPDERGFPDVPPGYEYALDETPREGGAHEEPGRAEPARAVASEHLSEHLSEPSDAADTARLLEELAGRVRRGELVLPGEPAPSQPAATLARLILALLGEARPAEREG